MVKKILTSIFCFLLICCIAVAFYFVKQEEVKITEQLVSVNDQIAPYQREITELREKIDRIEQGKENAEETPVRIIYGFYAQTPSEIMAEGAIVLDANADSELINAAKATGREIIYFFVPDAQVPQDGAVVILRTQNDTSENQKKITGVISRHIDKASAGPIEDDLINIPYVYYKDDESSILERLTSLQEALIIVFNPGAKNNLALLKSWFQNGSLIESTVAETKQFLMEDHLTEEPAEKNNAYIVELERRIDELQQQINEIYANSKEARTAQKRILNLLY